MASTHEFYGGLQASDVAGLTAGGGGHATGAVPAGQATATITHGLGTRDVAVMVRETGGYTYVPVANDAPDADTVRLQFATAPSAGQYRYVIFAGLGAPVPGPAAPLAHAPSHAAGGTDPVTPNTIGAAPTEHTHSGYAATGHDHDNRYAPAGHTHPRTMRYATTDIAASPKAGAPRIITTITVPDPGFDWYPLCFAELEISNDINGARPALKVRLGSVTGALYARGSGITGGNAYYMTQANPYPGASLSAGSSRVFHLVVENDYGGGVWIQTTDAFNPHFTVYVIPA